MVIKSTASKRRSTKLQPQACKTVHYKIDIRPLKAFASERLPKNWPLREALLAERDILEAQEFLAKMGTWLNLSRMTYY
jgi:hypothetical protein